MEQFTDSLPHSSSHGLSFQLGDNISNGANLSPIHKDWLIGVLKECVAPRLTN